MAKKEIVCLECDAHFTIKMESGFEIKYCPHCGEELEMDHSIDIEDN